MHYVAPDFISQFTFAKERLSVWETMPNQPRTTAPS